MRGERAEQDGEGGGEVRGGGRRGGEEEGELGGGREGRVAEDVEADGERQRRGGQERGRDVRRGEEVVGKAGGEERVREVGERRRGRGQAPDERRRRHHAAPLRLRAWARFSHLPQLLLPRRGVVSVESGRRGALALAGAALLDDRRRSLPADYCESTIV